LLLFNTFSKSLSRLLLPETSSNFAILSSRDFCPDINMSSLALSLELWSNNFSNVRVDT